MKQQDNVVLGRSRANPVPNRICIFDEAFSWPPRAKEEPSEPELGLSAEIDSKQSSNFPRKSHEIALILL